MLRQLLSLLNRIWYQKHWARWLLWPSSLVYRLIIAVRSALYRLGIFKTIHFKIPIIVVGNITVGGTGKTPLCIALCEQLKTQGHKPGIVSRGYGGKSASWPQMVTPDSDPNLVGDEPVLLAYRTQCPVVVDPDRVAAVQALITNFNCDVIVSDDGLQHTRMGRNIEIAVLDSERALGNGMCLPAGPLREPSARLHQVDYIIENGVDMLIKAERVYALHDSAHTLSPAEVAGKTVYAVAAIGHPQRFFNSLTAMGFTFKTTVFADHHAYTQADLDAIDADLIIMTEKDAVKCRRFNDERCFVLEVSAEVELTELVALD